MIHSNDPYHNRGAVEEDAPEQSGNTSLAGQLGHRDKNSLLKSSDTDFPEPGENPEHSGEKEEKNDLDEVA